MSAKHTTDKKHGVGRRKTAVAQIFLTDTPSEYTVNGMALEAYFPTTSLANTALRPLEVASQKEEFGVQAKVSGSGKNAQAGAVSLAIARALVAHDEGFRKQLKHAGLLSRDPRKKERKKPGLKGARRAEQFSKR